MNKEFIKWLKVNDYYNISINNRRYWRLYCLYYEYVLIDPFGDQDGDGFLYLEDVYDYITNNEQVAKYLEKIAVDEYLQAS